jgi:DNA-binding NarL/FixJ family response regulator
MTTYTQGEMAKRVLVADDNPLIRKALCKLFEVEENYDICSEATNGQEAIDLALKHSPDLIIMDLAMPVVNGLEAAHELKKMLPHVPIILFTQHGETGTTLFETYPSIDRAVPKSDPGALMKCVRALAPA